MAANLGSGKVTIYVDVDKSSTKRATNKIKESVSRSGQGLEDAFSKMLSTSFMQKAHDISKQFTQIYGKSILAATGVSQLITALGAMAGALGSVASSAAYAAGSLAVLPGAIAAAAQGGAALIIAFKGVGSALSEGFKAASSSGTGAGAAAASAANQTNAALKGVRDAQEQLNTAIRDGQRNVSDAQRSLQRTIADSNQKIADSLRDVRDAEQELAASGREVITAQDAVRRSQEALTRARKDAREEIQQLNFDTEDAVLGQQRAALSLRQAYEDWVRAQQSYQPGSMQYDDAKLSYQEAELAYRRSKDNASDMSKTQAEASRKGIEGTQAYQAALNDNIAAEKELAQAKQDYLKQEQALLDEKKKFYQEQQDALNSVADAERSLQRAREDSARNIKDANQGLKESKQALEDAKNGTNAAAGGTDAYAEAMAKLSPAAQEFVKSLVGMKDRFSEFKKAIQEPFFQEINGNFTEFANMMLDKMEPALAKTSDKIGFMGKEMMRTFVDHPKHMGLFEEILKANNGILDVFIKRNDGAGSAVQDLTVLFLRFLRAVQPVTKEVAKSLKTWIQGWRDFSDNTDNMQKISDYFKNAADRAGLLFRTFKSLAGATGELGKALDPVGARLIQDMGGAFDRLGDKIRKNSTLITWWGQQAGDITKNYGQIGKALLKAFWGPEQMEAAKESSKILADGLVGPIEEIGKAVAKAGPSLAELIVTLADIAVIFTDSGAMSLFIDTLNMIATAIKNVLQVPFVKEMIIFIGTIHAVTRAFAFALVPLKYFFSVIAGGAGTAGTALRNVVPFIKDIGTAFSNVGTKIAEGFGALTGSTGKFGGAVEKSGGKLKFLGGAAKGALTGAGKAATGALSMVGSVLGGGAITGGIMIAVAAIAAASMALDSARRPVEDINTEFDKLAETGKRIDFNKLKLADDSFIGKAVVVQDFADALDVAAGGIQGSAKKIGESGRDMSLLYSTENFSPLSFIKSISDANFAIDTQIDRVKELVAVDPSVAAQNWSVLNQEFRARGMTDEIGRIQETKGELEALGITIKENTGKWYVNTKAIEGQRLELSIMQEAASKFTEDLRTKIGYYNDEWKVSNETLKKTISELKDFDTLKFGGELKTKLHDISTQWTDILGKMLQAKKSPKEIIQQWENMRRETKEKLLAQGGNITEVEKQLDRTFGKKREIKVLAQEAKSEYQGRLAGKAAVKGFMQEDVGRTLGENILKGMVDAIRKGLAENFSWLPGDQGIPEAKPGSWSLPVGGSSGASAAGQTMSGYGPSSAIAGAEAAALSRSGGAAASLGAGILSVSSAGRALGPLAAGNTSLAGLSSLAVGMGAQGSGTSEILLNLIKNFMDLIDQMTSVRSEYDALDEATSAVWRNQDRDWGSVGKPVYEEVIKTVKDTSERSVEQFAGMRKGFASSFAAMRERWRSTEKPWATNAGKDLKAPFKNFTEFMGSKDKDHGFLGTNQSAMNSAEKIFSSGTDAITGIWKELPGQMKNAINPGLKDLNESVISPMKKTLRAYPGGDEYADKMQEFPAFARGGYVSGPGTGTSDSILSRISNGEFIMNARQTRRYRRILEKLNKGMKLTEQEIAQMYYGNVGGAGPWWSDKGYPGARAALGDTAFAANAEDRSLKWTMQGLVSQGLRTVSNQASSLAMLVPVLTYGLKGLKDVIGSWSSSYEKRQDAKYNVLVHPLGSSRTSKRGIYGPDTDKAFGEWRESGSFGIPGYTAHRHAGEDLQAAAGDTLRAAMSGMATAGTGSGTGNYVDIVGKINGKLVKMRYFHLSSMGRSGRVTAGDIIGRAGSTGWATGPHLHLQVTEDGVLKSPIEWFKKRGVTLAKGGYVPATPGGMLSVIGEAGRTERVEPLDSQGLSSRDRDIVNRLDLLLQQRDNTTVRVYIGDQELRGIVRTEVDNGTARIARSLTAGRKRMI